MEKGKSETLSHLRQAWDEGVSSGDAGSLDFAALKAEGWRRLASKRSRRPHPPSSSRP